MDCIFLIRRSGGATIPISRHEARELVKEFCSTHVIFQWVDGVPIEIKNSDGTITTDNSGHLTQGLSLRGPDSDGSVIPCYGFNDGICIESEKTEEVMKFCREIGNIYNLQIEEL